MEVDLSRESFRHYIIHLFNEIPTIEYGVLLMIICLGACGLIAVCGWRRGLRLTFALILIEYIFLIFESTLFLREYNENIGYNLFPFWSYREMLSGTDNLLSENIMNVLFFIPIGFWLRCSFQTTKWWMALLMGFVISVSIETLQYIYRRGFAETDDVMHNTLGCLIGVGLYYLIRYGYERFIKKRMAVL